MGWIVRSFLKSSLAWLSLGVTLGVAMGVHPAWTIYRPAHEHMNLVGFVSMMANAGLALMALGFAARVQSSVAPAIGGVLLGVGGTLSAVGAYLFAYNIWRTIDGSVAVVRVMARAAIRS